ncbi:hypothetical protein DERP_009933 [Dermatophagoides pteronyssinus]|uniref:BHLH domain-containing protein n=1 Tax=Dermatophagoides pteronyssinus TaxID=6956 RepID=A0ABQ8J1X7_DERPT|nr:hypothetical protein DERP_009933 [Dermatophagoides pteronyssinus]
MNQSILKPTIPSMMQQPRPSFPNPQTTRMIMMNNQNNPLPPKPMIMTPTTRFNSNPNILLGLDQQQQNGQRISKPLMEKRRRARINQCLTQLKLIVVDSAGQYTQNNKCKLEKADILELTVNYVKKLHQEHQQQQEEKSTKINDNQHYLSGYSECVRQICEYLTKNQTQISYDTLKDFLQQSLSITYQQHKHHDQQTTATTFVTPPSPAPSSESNHGCSPTTAAAATTTRIKIESNSESIKSSSIITNNCRKRKRINESDTDDNNTDNDEDYYYDYDDDDVIDDDDDDFGYGSDHQQQENYPLNLKIVKLDNQQPKQQHGYFDDNDDVWRPW